MTVYSSQPAAAAGIDNFVISSSADTNFGTNAENRHNANTTRTLLKFDLTSIPAGATVNSATLSLWKASAVGDNQTISAYAILVANTAWTEAGSTWNYAVASTVRWAGDTALDGGTDAGCSVAGTDYNASALGSFSFVSTDAIDTQYDITLNVAQIQTMLTANYGIVLRGSGTNSDSRTKSSDATTATSRPKLVIDYTEAGSPVTIDVPLTTMEYTTFLPSITSDGPVSSVTRQSGRGRSGFSLLRRLGL